MAADKQRPDCFGDFGKSITGMIACGVCAHYADCHTETLAAREADDRVRTAPERPFWWRRGKPQAEWEPEERSALCQGFWRRVKPPSW